MRRTGVGKDGERSLFLGRSSSEVPDRIGGGLGPASEVQLREHVAHVVPGGLGQMNRRAAISAFVRPSPSSASTSRSRLLSRPRPLGPVRPATPRSRRKAAAASASRGAPRRSNSASAVLRLADARPRAATASSARASSNRARAASSGRLLGGERGHGRAEDAARAAGSPSAAHHPTAREAAPSPRAWGATTGAATASSLAAVASAPSMSSWASWTSTEQVQEGGGEHVVVADRVQPAMQDGRRHRGLASRQVERGQRVGRLRELLEPGEELFGLLEPPLRHPELGELGGRVDAPRPEVRVLHRLQTLGEHPVGHLPLARSDEHLRAARVAEPEHRHVVVRGDPPLDGLPPLLDALPVRGELARGDPDADHVADDLQARDLAAGRRRERLVHLRHARHDVAGRDLRVAEPDERRRLEIRVIEPSRRLERHRRVRCHLPGASERSARVSDSQPCSGTSPASRSRPSAARTIPRSPRRSRRRPRTRGTARARSTAAARVSGLAVGGVRTLHVRDRALGVPNHQRARPSPSCAVGLASAFRAQPRTPHEPLPTPHVSGLSRHGRSGRARPRQAWLT